jgi:hypothetical protein
VVLHVHGLQPISLERVAGHHRVGDVRQADAEPGRVVVGERATADADRPGVARSSDDRAGPAVAVQTAEHLHGDHELCTVLPVELVV